MRIDEDVSVAAAVVDADAAATGLEKNRPPATQRPSQTDAVVVHAAAAAE